MNRRNRAGAMLVGLAVILLVLPAVFPVQPVLVHDTRPATQANESELKAENVTVIDYADLSERSKEPYVKALESNGQYRVPKGQGAPEFEYTTAEERAQAREDGVFRPDGVAIDRKGAENLPPAHEYGRVERSDDSEIGRETVRRYDLMQTRMGQPPLGSTAQLLRLGAVLLAVILLGAGGYLLSSRS